MDPFEEPEERWEGSGPPPWHPDYEEPETEPEYREEDENDGND